MTDERYSKIQDRYASVEFHLFMESRLKEEEDWDVCASSWLDEY
jgi:hypothetical protein